MCFVAHEDLLDTQDIGAILSEIVNLRTTVSKKTMTHVMWYLWNYTAERI